MASAALPAVHHPSWERARSDRCPVSREPAERRVADVMSDIERHYLYQKCGAIDKRKLRTTVRCSHLKRKHVAMPAGARKDPCTLSVHPGTAQAARV